MQRPLVLRRNLAKFLLKISGWKTTGTAPERGVLVGAPHTSNWDWVSTLLLCWSSGFQPLLMVKKELFVPPLSWLLKVTGAVRLDRSNPRETVDALIAAAKATDGPFFIALAAEGTRSKSTYWKSGFRRLAIDMDLPVVLASVDGPSKSINWGPNFYPSDDVIADMDIVREFSSTVTGINPENTTPPLLREEVEGFQPRPEKDA